MRSLRQFIKDFSPATITEKPVVPITTAAEDGYVLAEAMQEVITCGIFTRGGSLFICPPDDTTKARTIKIVTIPLRLYRKYNEVHSEWSKMQATLDALPTALRERKPAVRKPRVLMPSLDAPQSPAENPV